MKLGNGVGRESSPEAATYTYAGMGYPDPGALTQITDGHSITTCAYDAKGPLTSTLGGTNVTSDSSMNVAQWFDYAPYGSVIATTNTGQTTAGRQYINRFADQSNLDYMNARYYNPSQGQFITQDPVFWSSKQNLLNPQSLNSYSYSNDNPITGKDPDGLANSNTAQIVELIQQAVAALQQILSILSGGGGGGGSSQSTAPKGTTQGTITGGSGGSAPTPTPSKSFGNQWTPIIPAVVPALPSNSMAPNLLFDEKIRDQMLKRGWTEQSANDTYSESFTARPATDRTPGPSESQWEPATAHYNEDGTHIIVNNESGKVIQVTNNAQVKTGEWVPDSSIQDPYLPFPESGALPEGPIEFMW